jgi:endonuclease III
VKIETRAYTSAGGVVIDATGEQVLVLVRPEHDEVRLPKGHIESNESPAAAALREVQEETGYGHLEIMADLGEQLVTFLNNDRIIRRTEHYYLMQVQSLTRVKQPETDEEQFFTVWVPWDQADEHITYEAEREWVRRAKQAWDACVITYENEHALLDKAREIHARLLEVYGDKEEEHESDPVDTLVNTILSQNTNDRNRDIAFEQLRDRFPSWEAVRDASEEEVITVIRPAGLAPTKGPRIQAALRAITAKQGEITLDFLRTKPLEEARAWLLDLNGVGPKTAAIVLLFAMGHPAFPVDTHIHRVSRRLGLISEKASREQAHDLLEALLPPEMYYTYHLNLIEHGRTTCAARTPRCEQCVLTDLCHYYQKRRTTTHAGT